MVMHRESKGGKPIDPEWHEFARTAKETTFSLAEWADEEIGRWDLDEDTRRPTGRENPRTYTVGRPIQTATDEKNGTDIRTLDNR